MEVSFHHVIHPLQHEKKEQELEERQFKEKNLTREQNMRKNRMEFETETCSECLV